MTRQGALLRGDITGPSVCRRLLHVDSRWQLFGCSREVHVKGQDMQPKVLSDRLTASITGKNNIFELQSFKRWKSICCSLGEKHMTLYSS